MLLFPCLSCVPSLALQLTHLSLATESFLGAVVPLTALLQLEQLRLSDGIRSSQAMLLVLPAPAVHWPRLRAYHLVRNSNNRWVVRSWRERCNGLLDRLEPRDAHACASVQRAPGSCSQPLLACRLPASRPQPALPCPAVLAQVEGCRVRAAYYATCQYMKYSIGEDWMEESWPADSCLTGQLSLTGAVGLGPLLLEALLPQGKQGLDGGGSRCRCRPGTSVPPHPPHCPAGTALGKPALTALCLTAGSSLPAGAEPAPAGAADWAVVSKLQRLELYSTDCGDGSTLAALLQQAPEVEALWLSSCNLTQVPAVVTALRGLTELSLSSNGLSDLPPGDWLAGAALGRLASGPGQHARRVGECGTCCMHARAEPG